MISSCRNTSLVSTEKQRGPSDTLGGAVWERKGEEVGAPTNVVQVDHSGDMSTLESVCNSGQKYYLNTEIDLNRMAVGSPVPSLDPVIQSHHATYLLYLSRLN